MHNPVKILVECSAMIPSVRVGVIEPLKPIVESGECEVRFKKITDVKKTDIIWCDILVCIRGFEYAEEFLVETAKKAGRYIIYFLDDDLLNVPSNIEKSMDLSFKRNQKIIESILKRIDLLWCVNPFIAKKYCKLSKSKYFVSKVPFEMPQIIAPKAKYSGDEIINILYAGSTDHSETLKDFVVPAVKLICNEFKDSVRFTFIGANPQIYGFQNVSYINYIENYDEYKKVVANGNYDIGIAAIRKDDFYKYKYYNKYIEYTSIGAVGVYTKSEPYTLVIDNEINGLLCENTVESWYDTLKKAILDDDLRFRCVGNAVKKLLVDYSYCVVADELKNNIPEFTRFHAKIVSKNKIKLPNLKFIFYWDRIKYILVTQGFKGIFSIIFKVLKKTKKYYLKRKYNDA